VVGEHGGHVALVDGCGPALDQVADLLFVGHSGSSSRTARTGGTLVRTQIHRDRFIATGKMGA
jgi:hypothetical protein